MENIRKKKEVSRLIQEVQGMTNRVPKRQTIKWKELKQQRNN